MSALTKPILLAIIGILSVVLVLQLANLVTDNTSVTEIEIETCNITSLFGSLKDVPKSDIYYRTDYDLKAEVNGTTIYFGDNLVMVCGVTNGTI